MEEARQRPAWSVEAAPARLELASAEVDAIYHARSKPIRPNRFRPIRSLLATSRNPNVALEAATVEVAAVAAAACWRVAGSTPARGMEELQEGGSERVGQPTPTEFGK